MNGGARPAIGDDDTPRRHVHRYEAGPGRPRPEAIPRISTTPLRGRSRAAQQDAPEGSSPSTFSCHRSRSGRTMARLRLWRMAQAVLERPIPRCRGSWSAGRPGVGGGSRVRCSTVPAGTAVSRWPRERRVSAAPGTTEASGPARLGQREPAGLLVVDAPLKLSEGAREVRPSLSRDLHDLVQRRARPGV